MDLTPTTSTTKKVRAKSPAAALKEKTAAPKTVRARKKSVSEPILAPQSSGVALSSEQLTAMIATEAYYIAAQRNFAPGNEMDDWLAAERQVLNSL